MPVVLSSSRPLSHRIFLYDVRLRIRVRVSTGFKWGRNFLRNDRGTNHIRHPDANQLALEWRNQEWSPNLAGPSNQEDIYRSWRGRWDRMETRDSKPLSPVILTQSGDLA
jgi:hypothetical protein